MSFGNVVRGAAPRRRQARLGRWTRRAGAVAISAALLGIVPAAMAGASTAAPAQDRSAAAKTVTLGMLQCIRSEDRGGEGDELYIRVDGKKIWTSADSVGDGDEIAVNRKVAVGSTVALYDDDWPDGDDFLGSDIVEGDRGTLVFNNDDAKYFLDYD